ncbi:MAG: TonB-dependent receptor [Methylophaga sp.]|nr:MAG: TonB-dependent receptor [Methylophaga sp.]
MNLPHKRSILSLIILSTLTSTAFSAEDSVELTEIEVIGTTPLHGVGLPADQIASNIQSATAEEIENSQSLDISDFMNSTLNSVSINSAQNNPFQPDLQFRGFTASPLVGNSQGLSVYVDGVRVNEPFGDAVNFELIPQAAIASMNLMPGSNPIFGLNTLGGAISIQTKNGFTHQGHSLETYGGSFGRWSTTVESGGSDGNLAYYVTGSHIEEDGWRDESESDIDQLFAKVSYQNESSTLDFSLMGVDSDLNGNGASPVELVKIDREAVFTYPDNTQNELRMLSLNGSHWLNDSLLLSANTYFRKNDRETFNGDGAELEFDGAGDLVEEGETDKLEDVNGNVINETDLGSPDDDDLALNNTSTTEQDSYGLSVQFTFLNALFDKENQLIVGASYDKSDVNYTANSEVAVFRADRGTNGTDVLLAETAVDGKIDTKTFGLFFTDTISMTDKFALTLAARYNRTEIDISGTSGNGETNLNERNETHVFNRINPSLGFTYAMSETTGIYGGYSESNRAPTPSELTCADAAHPCALPNSFLSDPPLDDVVAKTFEAGVRGTMGNVNWSFGFFNTTLKDDILFFPDTDAPAGQLNVGIFDNVDRTQRKGIEFGLSGKRENLTWTANYSMIDATYESSFGYIDHEGDTQRVTSGNSIPGIPKNNIKIGLDYAFTPAFSLGMNASYHSGQYFRGDDINEDDQLDGYGVVNLHSRYKLNNNVEFFAKVDNLFDSEYETFGIYGEPNEAPGVRSLTDEHFVGTSAPRAGWIGIKVSM